MSTAQSLTELEYPESDGKPMAETDLHRDWMVRIIDLLRQRYRGEPVYVSGNLMVYYVEGNPKKSVAPDTFVVKGVDPGRRRIYKIWDEGRAPDVVIETTSRKTRSEDTKSKPKTYAKIGIPEYFLYDPTADYLDPPLQGYRLVGTIYERIAPDANGWLECRSLGFRLGLKGRDLELRESLTDQVLRTDAEAEQEAREAEQRARGNAELRIRELEAELQKLREKPAVSG
jgi:Uma2 family endonuclease